MSHSVSHNGSMRTTPDQVDALEPGEIFVFGSNIQGAHGGGAARIAHQRFGAEYGVGEGLTGQSYALPTMEGRDAFQSAARRFVDFAGSRRDLVFLLTKVGCGIAGYDESDVAEWFSDTPDNVVKPPGW